MIELLFMFIFSLFAVLLYHVDMKQQYRLNKRKNESFKAFKYRKIKVSNY